jgi:DNA-binding beta-propeller fold protein YncE
MAHQVREGIGSLKSLGLLVPVLLAAGALASACSSGGSASPSSDAGVQADTGPGPLEATPPGTIAASQVLDAVSSTVVFDRLRGGVWTANGDVGTVSYADVDHGKVVSEIPIGMEVTSVALSPDSVWLAAVDHTAATVTLVDATSFAVKRTIALGTHPRAAVWDALDPRWLYVSLEDDGAIAIVDRTLGVLDHTVSVGRLPAGLAVSRLRRELAIAHRIDAAITILPLDGAYAPADQDAPAVDIPLAYQPPVSDDTQPNGQPFALENLAWAIDGQTAWVPHELLANHHPFQFQRNLFPAVSVVDLAARAEVQTNPNDPNGVIAGRKLLFGAIDIPDPMGNVSVVSQPCAAALHPNGVAAYVVACASEDLLTFDLTAGIAVDLLRGLPGNHPTGMTLDGTGARIFVVSDQSHTLLTLDTAGGSLLGHVTAVGTPLTLVAKDPIDPQLRAGYELFFNAESALFPYATTGNNWMSCGGCHLDGFVSTNEVFFEALTPLDPAQDARIGHENLQDLFSTAPTPTSPTFQPHDILAAMRDMGGLAPDRTGAVRTGEIDPSNPPAAAVTMAQQLAQVIAKNLPVGPSWLLPDLPAPDVSYDTSWCGKCHPSEYKAWSESAHAHSAADVMVKYGSQVEQQLVGTQYSRQCAGCHDPVSVRLGDTSFTSGRGITCLGCHDVTRLLRAGGNGDMEAVSHDWTQDHVQRAAASLTYLQSANFCAVCHQQFVPGNGIVGIATLDEWQASSFSPGTPCVDCHMPDVGMGVHDHSVPGGNVYVAQQFGETAFAQEVAAKMASAIQLQAFAAPDGVHVVVLNTGAGHAFPTGVTDIREPWLEAHAVDNGGNVIASYGAPDSTGLLPPDATRLGVDIAGADGGLLYRHELTAMTSIPFDRVVPAGSSVEVVIPTPSTLPTGATGYQAVLYYHNIRTPYYRDAMGDMTGSAPAVEVAHVAVSQ